MQISSPSTRLLVNKELEFSYRKSKRRKIIEKTTQYTPRSFKVTSISRVVGTIEGVETMMRYQLEGPDNGLITVENDCHLFGIIRSKQPKLHDEIKLLTLAAEYPYWFS